MPRNFCESHLEEAALEWFEELGYEIVFAPDIAQDGEYSEREDYSDVILNDRLKEALKRINPRMPEGALADAFRQITIPQSPSLIMNNKSFQKMITDGIDVQVKQSDASYRTEKVYVFKLIERLDLIRELLYGHDYSKFFTGKPSEKLQAIVETMDYIIGLRENKKNDYIKLVTEMAGFYSLCATTAAAVSLNVPLHLWAGQCNEQ